MHLNLSVTRSGRGEPLLLLHGMGSSRRDFAPLLPALSAAFEVVALDLPGSGRSAHLEQRPTVAAITDAVEATLDAEGLGRVHVLGNSLGARVALELARRCRARSVVAIAPSGLNALPERAYQGTGMAVARVAFRSVGPLIKPLSRSALGRTALLTALKGRPWQATPDEALAARDGFSDARDYWRTLLWALLLDVPRGMDQIDCPVTLVQGAADLVASGQTMRYLPLVPGSRFRPLLAGGHSPLSDRPGTIVRLVHQTAARSTDAAPVRLATAA
ncbi:Pimeloyl-ACP methyl ester carboxylesterase [Modestobacter sp. DSM 44400]|uniref:alpha/beta fold hydrolase n=1 Tax=Modestobacter sp. DSM 44400 TaxID=1550230 RepID=UPI00089A5FE9|nr:alpha/beta fold hydrolase [Modestobacter sp. DSM 44400]SDY09016.1 Pimeloyl-ACP methyl ester carboxylesterase [Modestobacter sp. DSM 44400]